MKECNSTTKCRLNGASLGRGAWKTFAKALKCYSEHSVAPMNSLEKKRKLGNELGDVNKYEVVHIDFSNHLFKLINQWKLFSICVFITYYNFSFV